MSLTQREFRKNLVKAKKAKRIRKIKEKRRALRAKNGQPSPNGVKPARVSLPHMSDTLPVPAAMLAQPAQSDQ
jgi:hypothetical protein